MISFFCFSITSNYCELNLFYSKSSFFKDLFYSSFAFKLDVSITTWSWCCIWSFSVIYYYCYYLSYLLRFSSFCWSDCSLANNWFNYSLLYLTNLSLSINCFLSYSIFDVFFSISFISSLSWVSNKLIFSYASFFRVASYCIALFFS